VNRVPQRSRDSLENGPVSSLRRSNPRRRRLRRLRLQIESTQHRPDTDPSIRPPNWWPEARNFTERSIRWRLSSLLLSSSRALLPLLVRKPSSTATIVRSQFRGVLPEGTQERYRIVALPGLPLDPGEDWEHDLPQPRNTRRSLMQKIVDTLREAQSTHVEKLIDWLRIPSVSTDSARIQEVRQAGEFVLNELQSAGFEARIDETPGHPVVLAKWHGAPDAPTLLVYGHYDVQPPEPLELWRHGAFEPTIEGEDLIARGATDDKGQALALVLGMGGVLRETGSLPINVTFLIEGEEEIGSPHLEPYIKAHAEELKADIALISDCSQFGPGMPAITVGLKGLVYMQVDLIGPNRDLHSGSFGGAVDNPANVLATMLGKLKDDQGRVTIPGFYEKVRDLTDEEREEISRLPFSEEAFAKELEVDQLHGEAGYSTLERKWARPTLDVNGLLSGWTGEGAKTVLPSKAMAKFSMRLVADQDPDEIETLARRYLEEICPPTCTMKIHCDHGAKPVLVDTSNPWLTAASRAVEKGFGKSPVQIREGGSIPVVSILKEQLGIDTILLGLGLPDDNAHSPNEKFHLPDYQRGIETAAWLLDEMAS